jgi:hypothetical protein
MTAPTDRVQLLKQESTAIGGQDADSRDYPVPINSQQDAPEVMGIFLQDASNRDETTYITRAGNNMLFRDVSNPVEKTLTDLLAAGSGISEAQHEALDTLVHDVAETSYVEVTRASGQVSNVTVWETAAKLKKVREAAVTRASGQVSVVVETQYDAAGLAIAGQVLTHTVTRSSGQVASIATVQT